MWIFLHSLPNLGMAQAHKIDSLLAVLKVAPLDTHRVNAVNELANQYTISGNTSEALKYALMADSLSIKLSYLRGRARAHNSIGNAYLKQKKLDASKESLLKSITYAKASNFKHAEAKAFRYLSSVEHALGNPTEAIHCLEKSLALQRELQNISEMGICLSNLSSTLMEMGEYEKGIEYALENLELQEIAGDLVMMRDMYKNLSFAYNRLNNSSQMIYYFSKGLEASKKLGDFQGMEYFNLRLAQEHRILGHHQIALDHLHEAEEGIERTGNKAFLINIYTDFGLIYTDKGEPEEAMKYYSKALHTGEELNLPITSHLYHSIGQLLLNKGDLPSAISMFMKGLKIEEEQKSPGLSSYYQNIGMLYQQNKEYEEALNYFKKALEAGMSTGNKIDMAYSYSQLTALYTTLEDFDEAFQYANSGIQICEQIGLEKLLFWNYIALGSLLTQKGDYPTAQSYLEKALHRGEKANDKKFIAECHFRLGELFMLSGDYFRAEEHLKNSQEITHVLGGRSDLINVYSGLTRLDTLKGNFRSAFYHYQQKMVYEDSLMNEDVSTQIAEIREKYESEKKDKEILKLESDKKINLLLMQATADSLAIAAAETRRLILEKDRIQALNNANEKELALLSVEKELQALEISKKNTEYLAEKAENERNKSNLAMLSQEARIKDLELRRSKLMRNVMLGSLVVLCFLGWFAYVHYSTRQQLKLQKLRNKIASDLHDDVGSTLSSISIFSDMVKLQSKEVNPLLETIGESSKKMLDAMGDIVWTINPENDDFEKILTRMRSFAYELLGAKKIEFAFDADDQLRELKVPMEVRKNLFLIFKEATNNLVKYSEADMAQFRIKEENKELTMTIRDNGKGFEEETTVSGNGLKNMKKRAEEIGGRLWIESRRDEGTLITLKVAV